MNIIMIKLLEMITRGVQRQIYFDLISFKVETTSQISRKTNKFKC